MIRKNDYWGIRVNPSYIDPDQGKSRALDLSALWTHTYEDGVVPYSLTVDFKLLIECKKLPGNAWTFFVPGEPLGAAVYNVASSITFGNRTLEFEPLQSAFRRAIIPEATTELYRETVLDKNRSNKRDDNIYEASLTLAKAHSFFLEMKTKDCDEYSGSYVADALDEGEVTLDEFRSGKAELFDYAYVFVPLIVFEGSLYIADVGSKKLTKANLVRLSVGNQFKNAWAPMPIDICTPQYLPTYIAAVENAIKMFSDDIHSTEYSRTGGPHLEEYDRTKSWFQNHYLDFAELIRYQLPAEEKGRAEEGLDNLR